MRESLPVFYSSLREESVRLSCWARVPCCVMEEDHLRNSRNNAAARSGKERRRDV